MRVERMRPVKAWCNVAKEEVTWVDVERQFATMKAERQDIDVGLVFQISDWLQIGFRFISD